jgi:hypothetical protein
MSVRTDVDGYTEYSLGRRTQVVKGAVCKTAIHRFKSGRRLFSFLTILPERSQTFLFLSALSAVGQNTPRALSAE